MEEKELYPKGTVQQTDDFALRQKMKRIVGDNIESLLKQGTIDAFKKAGYGHDEKDNYMYVIAAGGDDGKERKVGQMTKEGGLIVTTSNTKMLNMGATKPVSYIQKVTTFGSKKIISSIKLSIDGNILHIDYMNTEAASFQESSKGNTYTTNPLNKVGNVGIDTEDKFKKEFKSFFESIAEAEVAYITETKIGNDDKTKKNMNDSIVKENKYNMKLTDLFSSTFEDAGSKIDNLVKEGFISKLMNNKETNCEDCCKLKKNNKSDATSVTDRAKLSDCKKLSCKCDEESSGAAAVVAEETKKDAPVGCKCGGKCSCEKDKILVGSEKEEFLEEVTTTAGSGAGYQPKACFTKDGKTPELKANKDFIQVSKLDESIKDTTYGQMRTQRAHLTRQNDGSYKVISENTKPLKTPYVESVPMGKDGWPPVGMDVNHTEGNMVGTKVGSKEELAKTGHGELSKLEKEEKDSEEQYTKSKDLSKRKFSDLKENEEKGINKRYIITEKLSKENQVKRWKELCECDCFRDIKDTADTVPSAEYDAIANKEFEANNKSLESHLTDTQFSGAKAGHLTVPKAMGSMIVFSLSESDIRQNKMYLIDHFTNKLVLNPLYKAAK